MYNVLCRSLWISAAVVETFGSHVCGSCSFVFKKAALEFPQLINFVGPDLKFINGMGFNWFASSYQKVLAPVNGLFCYWYELFSVHKIWPLSFLGFVPTNWHKMSLMVKPNRESVKRGQLSWRRAEELAETRSSGSPTPGGSRPMISPKLSLLYIILINYLF